MFFLYRENGDFVILMKYIYIGLPFELKGSCKPCFACPLLDFLGRGRWWDDMIYWGKSSSPLLQALNLMDWNLSEFFFNGEILLFSENKLEKNLKWKLCEMCFSPWAIQTATKSNHIHPTQGNLPRGSLHNWQKEAWVLWNSPGNAYSTKEHSESNGDNPPFC